MGGAAQRRPLLLEQLIESLHAFVDHEGQQVLSDDQGQLEGTVPVGENETPFRSHHDTRDIPGHTFRART